MIATWGWTPQFAPTAIEVFGALELPGGSTLPTEDTRLVVAISAAEVTLQTNLFTRQHHIA